MQAAVVAAELRGRARRTTAATPCDPSAGSTQTSASRARSAGPIVAKRPSASRTCASVAEPLGEPGDHRLGGARHACAGTRRATSPPARCASSAAARATARRGSRLRSGSTGTCPWSAVTSTSAPGTARTPSSSASSALDRRGVELRRLAARGDDPSRRSGPSTGTRSRRPPARRRSAATPRRTSRTAAAARRRRRRGRTATARTSPAAARSPAPAGAGTACRRRGSRPQSSPRSGTTTSSSDGSYTFHSYRPCSPTGRPVCIVVTCAVVVGGNCVAIGVISSRRRNGWSAWRSRNRRPNASSRTTPTPGARRSSAAARRGRDVRERAHRRTLAFGRVQLWTHHRWQFPLPETNRFPLAKYGLLRRADGGGRP